MIYPFQTSDLNNISILDFKTGDVTGDEILDYVYLAGMKNTPEDIFADKIELMVYEGKSNQLMNHKLENVAGCNARLYLGSFFSKARNDILIIIDSSSNQGCTQAYLYTVVGNNFELLFGSTSFNEKSLYKASYQDGFKLAVSGCRSSTALFSIDISSNLKSYISSGLYDENGILLKSADGTVSGLGTLIPTVEDFNSGVYQLLARQQITGINNERLGYVQTYLRLDGTEYVIDRVEVSIPPL